MFTKIVQRRYGDFAFAPRTQFFQQLEFVNTVPADFISKI